MAKNEESVNLIDIFKEFKDFKNIDRQTFINVLEDSFRNVIAKMYGSDANYDVIINPDKGDLEIYRNRLVMEDGDVANPETQIELSEARQIDDEAEIGDEITDKVEFSSFGRRMILNLRQTLASKILELQKENLYLKYSDMLGQVVSGELYQVWKKEMLLLDDEGNEAVRVSETNAGDIVTDAFRFVTGSDIAVLNCGSIRNEVKAGDLTYGDILTLLPYDNYVVVAEVTGSTILAMLNKLVSFLPNPDGQFPQVSGIKFIIHEREHRVSDVKILNSATQHYEPLNPDRVYSLATTKYCVTDGGLHNTLKGSKITWETQRTYYDIFIEYVTKNLNGHIGQEYAEPQGRMIKKP